MDELPGSKADHCRHHERCAKIRRRFSSCGVHVPETVRLPESRDLGIAVKNQDQDVIVKRLQA